MYKTEFTLTKHYNLRLLISFKPLLIYIYMHIWANESILVLYMEYIISYDFICIIDKEIIIL